jgi:hypothetical protein
MLPVFLDSSSLLLAGFPTPAHAIGSTGVLLLLVAFFLNLFGFLSRRSRAYQLLNAIGAGLACYSAFLIDFMPFVVLEGTWSLVALVALFGYQTSSNTPTTGA